MTIILNKEVAEKVLNVVDQGLVAGLGKPKPGHMCVEAAVCFALGLPHSDKPTCVGEAVRIFKINLNDAAWPTDEDRTAGMRKLAVAQLGSDKIDQWAFAKYVAFHSMKKILPFVIRNAVKPGDKFEKEIEKAAKDCEDAVDHDSAVEATKRAKAIMNDANAYANAYAYANANANANAYAYANAYANANANAYAEFRLKILNMSAQIALDALIELKSPGCEWLYLCDIGATV